MTQDAWQEPFRELRSKLQAVVDSDVRLYHSVLMAPFHEWTDLEELVLWLEPSLMGEDLVLRIDTPTTGCKFHAHLFFGEQATIQYLLNSLGSLHSWCQHVPVGLLPGFALPPVSRQTEMNLVLWCNWLLCLGWKSKRWYFAADVGVQKSIDVIYNFPWAEFRHPPEIDPRPILTHQKSVTTPFDLWPRLFERDSLNMPEIIDAYLVDSGAAICGEFCKASIAGIDILLSLSSPAPDQKNSVDQKPRRSGVRKSTRGKIEAELIQVRAVLLQRHCYEKDIEKRRQPMTQDEIALALNWVSPSGKTNQAKVHRRLAEMLGDPSTYKRCFVDDFAYERFLKQLKPTSFKTD
jgi:hypothetical protein